MTDWNKSIVIIVPAELLDKANRLACALGHDVPPGNTFSVELTDGTNTFYGCQTPAKQEFLDILAAAGEGQLPPELEEFGVTPEDVDQILQKMIIDEREDDTRHFTDVIVANNLTRVAVE